MALQAYADPTEMPASEASRVAMLLAIDEADLLSDVQLARIVSGGLLPASAIALAEVLGRNRVVGPVVPEATLRRARKARKALPRQLSERLYEVGRVVDAVSRVYHGDRAAIEPPEPPASLAGRRDAVRHGALQLGGYRSGPQSHRSRGGRRSSLTTPRTLRETMRAYRIGDPAGQFPVWSAEGARRVSGRWHEPGAEVIYASTTCSTAMLERSRVGTAPRRRTSTSSRSPLRRSIREIFRRFFRMH